MCYGTRVVESKKQLQAFYDVTVLEGKRKIEGELTYHHANGFSHPLLWIIPQEKNHGITPALWGILPQNELGENHEAYYKKAVRFGGGLNAREDKLFDHFIYKQSALTRRCIIPVSGFYEPHTAPKKFKIPFYFERQNKSPSSLAGLYTITTDGYVSFTILTKRATPLFSKIHNIKDRRPVIVNDKDLKVWLSNDLKEKDISEIIKNDMPDEDLHAYPISKDLYSPKVDSNRENIIEKMDYPQLEILY